MNQTNAVLKLGDTVPEFELATYDPVKQDFGTFRVSDQIKNKRWTILFFYPADFTFVWATEFAALAEQQERFQKMGCDVVTVSTDTQFTHLAWQRDEKDLAKVRFQMAADPTGRISRLFGIYDEDTGLAVRGTFIISPEGKVLSAEINFYNLGRNIDELMRKFKANLYLSRKTSEACPSKWKEEGDRTLTPSARLVGRVGEETQTQQAG